MENKRLDYLDSWRGIAALSVVIFHCLISFVIFSDANYDGVYANGLIKFLTESPLKLLWSGKEPVLLFFVLSGFVLSLSFYKQNTFSYPAFILKRFIRIYIPYIIVMLISVILVTIFYNMNNIAGLSQTFENRWDHQVSLKAIVAYLIMINFDTANVNGVVWTLYHEMRISIVFPLLMLIIIKFKGLKSVVLNSVLVGSVYFILNALASANILGQGNVFMELRDSAFYTIFFLMGAYLAKYRQKVAAYISNKNIKIKVIFSLVMIFLIHTRWLNSLVELRVEYLDLLSGVGIIMLFSITLSSDAFQKVLCSKPILFLGKISYSLYLTHIIVIMLLVILLGSFLGYEIAILLTIPLSIPAAWLTYVLIEEPSATLSRKVRIGVKRKDNTEDNKSISA